MTRVSLLHTAAAAALALGALTAFAPAAMAQAAHDTLAKIVQPIPPRNVSLNLPLSDELRALFAQPIDEPIEAYNRR